MLNLKRLHLLRQLSILGSLARVAQAEGLTRPAVSRQLSLLEEEVGATLFERDGRGVSLTQEGRRLAGYMPRLFGLLQEIETDIANRKQQPDQPLRMAGIGSVLIGILPAAQAELHVRYPALAIHVEEKESEESLQLVVGKQIDIAIYDAHLDISKVAPMLDVYKLCSDSMVVVCSKRHHLADARSISLDSLRAEHWALNQASTPYYDFILSRCADAGFQPNIVVSCRNMLAALTSVVSHNLITIMPALAARSPLVNEAFATLELEPPLERDIHAACLRGGGRRAVISSALRALRNAARELRAGG